MVDALNVVDGIGLGRPLCQEPYLCSHILAGKVNAAILLQLSQYDFLTTATAAMMHIRQIGNHHQPINLGLPDNAPAFQQAVGEYMAAKQQDRAGEIYAPPAIRDYDLALYPEVA